MHHPVVTTYSPKEQDFAPEFILPGIPAFIFRPTGNIHPTASGCNSQPGFRRQVLFGLWKHLALQTRLAVEPLVGTRYENGQIDNLLG